MALKARRTSLTATSVGPTFSLAALRDVFAGDRPGSVDEAYRRAAPVYDGFRWLWLRLGSASAERARFQAAVDVIRPGAQILDAGAGTGQLARQLHQANPDAHFTLLDLSAAMLARAGDVPGRHVLGSVTELPFRDLQSDLIVTGWVMETLDEPGKVLEDFARGGRARGPRTSVVWRGLRWSSPAARRWRRRGRNYRSLDRRSRSPRSPRCQGATQG